jgi:lipid A ethanolaminephosphotransferase
MRNHKELRYLINPLNALYALGHAAARPLRRPAGVAVLGADARAPDSSDHPPLVVLVLGETGRSGNFGLNGYTRPTTPELERHGAASALHATSCGTSTAASVPCMFSHLGRTGFDGRDRDYETLVDVLQHAGLAVLWIDNQSGCKGVCDRIPHVDTATLNDPRLCPGGQCLDEIMLEGLEQRLAALPAERVARGVVLVLHQMGSHGPAYHLRSPPAFKKFLPECTSANLQDCSRTELLNAYDNSIAYTDHFLGSTIDWLQRQRRFDTAMLYVADHGESLGENNLYLHGMPFGIAPDVQKHVPWVTWLSTGFEHRTGIATECLRSRRSLPLSHDNYFHSVLGLMQVTSAVYDRRLDAYATCAAH